jgi:hypothetical protein
MKRESPRIIYHLTPRHVYGRSINRLGNYNCKGFENSNFIHSTCDLKELKRIADLLFTKAVRHHERPENVGRFYEEPSVKFLLLKIDRKKIRARMGFVKPGYYHIHGSLPRESYELLEVKRDSKGRFLI